MARYRKLLTTKAPKQIEQAAADNIIVAPMELVAPAPRRQNPYPGASEPKKGARKPKAKPWAEEVTSLYDGHENFLVRTALIRPPTFQAGHQGPDLTDPSAVERLVAHLRHADQEHFVVLALNNQLRLQAIHETAVGTVSGVSLEIRSILKILVLTAATGAIVVHNHPGGVAMPSREDIDTTKKVAEAMKCVGMKLVDHIIVAAGGAYSFFEKGILPET